MIGDGYVDHDRVGIVVRIFSVGAQASLEFRGQLRADVEFGIDVGVGHELEIVLALTLGHR